MELLLWAAAGLSWLLLSLFLVPFVSKEKGRGWLIWIAVSLMFSPLIALIALAALPDLHERRLLRRIANRLSGSDVAAREDAERNATDRLLNRRPRR